MLPLRMVVAKLLNIVYILVIDLNGRWEPSKPRKLFSIEVEVPFEGRKLERQSITNITSTAQRSKVFSTSTMRTEGRVEAQRGSASSRSLPQPLRKTERDTRTITKRLPFILLLVLSAISILRLVRIETTPGSYSSVPATHEGSPKNLSSFPSFKCSKLSLPLSTKEFRLLTDLISRRAPCNLLVFGLGIQTSVFASLNRGGTTIFLEDDNEQIGSAAQRMNPAHTYHVKYPTQAGQAYELLRNARENPACRPVQPELFRSPSCPLTLSSLPKVVYDTQWDMVVIDGPSGNCLEAPGRMEVIYTTGLMARLSKVTDVIVHDVHRTVEKWYSWEFLCQENLVASKGRLWHFCIKGNHSATHFCSNETFSIN